MSYAHVDVNIVNSWRLYIYESCSAFENGVAEKGVARCGDFGGRFVL